MTSVLCFSDLDMPRGVDGLRHAVLIRDGWPPIKVIAVSGHVDDPADLIPAIQGFPKPYREEEIVETIR